MLKFYKRVISTYHNDSKIASLSAGVLCAEESENLSEAQIIKVNWDNLSKVFKKYGACLAFNVWNLRRGRRVSFPSNCFTFKKDFRNVKEWKEDLNITLKIQHIEFQPTMRDVLNLSADKAIKYLTERGITLNELPRKN